MRRNQLDWQIADLQTVAARRVNRDVKAVHSDVTAAGKGTSCASTTMRYLSLSNLADVEVCEYPGSNKLGALADAQKPQCPPRGRFDTIEAVLMR